MFGMPKRVKLNKNMPYRLIYNNEDINIKLSKIVTVEDKIDSLIKTDKLLFRYGFFIRNQKAFNSMFFNFKIDIVFTNFNGRIVKTIQSFPTNSISKYFDEAHVCIVLPEHTVDYFDINEGSHIKIEKI
jgi:uncharacterized membrane protein (UPF0127 family)